MIAIVGAGPTGTYLAHLLARSGEQVKVFEAKETIGLPVQCTGLMTKELFNLIPKDKSFIINKLDGAHIIGPNKTATIPLEEYVICRKTFDQHVADIAHDSGAEILRSHRFTGIENGKAVFRHKGERVEMPYDKIVGADGPMSAVANAFGLMSGRKYWVGHQITLEGDFDPDKFEAHFGDFAPGFFGWSVPESATRARIGIATEHNTRAHFAAFSKKIRGKIVDAQAGLIPIYCPGMRASDPTRNAYLVGDAAGVVKATTGGGVITGMLSSNILSDCLLRDADYDKALRPLKRELWIHHRIRHALNRFSEQDYDYLIKLIGQDKAQKILSEHPREFPSRFMLKLALAEPRLAAFIRFIF